MSILRQAAGQPFWPWNVEDRREQGERSHTGQHVCGGLVGLVARQQVLQGTEGAERPCAEASDGHWLFHLTARHEGMPQHTVGLLQ